MSIIRCTKVASMDFDDMTYSNGPVQIWSYVELGVAILVTNLPIMRYVATYQK